MRTSTMPSPWSLVLRRRLASPVASEGFWLADDLNDLSAVAQLIIEEDSPKGEEDSDCSASGGRKTVKGRVHVYSFLGWSEAEGNDADDNEAAPLNPTEEANIKPLVSEAIRVLVEVGFGAAGSDDRNAKSSSTGCERSPPRLRVGAMFPGVDRRLLGTVRSALAVLPARDDDSEAATPEGLALGLGFKPAWSTGCGMYMYRGGRRNPLPVVKDPPPGCVIRPLTLEDAELVNSRWEYRSDDSMHLIRRMIDISASSDHDSKKRGGCLGVEVNGELVAWVLRYLDGAVGMIWTEEGHRRRGFASTLISAVMADFMNQQRDERDMVDICGRFLFAFVVDENDASQAMFRRLGWSRETSADWAGFVSFGNKGKPSKEGVCQCKLSRVEAHF